MSAAKQVIIIFAGTNGYLDDIEITKVKKFESDLFAFIESKHPDIEKELTEKKVISDDLKERLMSVVTEFKKDFI